MGYCNRWLQAYAFVCGAFVVAFSSTIHMNYECFLTAVKKKYEICTSDL